MHGFGSQPRLRTASKLAESVNRRDERESRCGNCAALLGLRRAETRVHDFVLQVKSSISTDPANFKLQTAELNQPPKYPELQTEPQPAWNMATVILKHVELFQACVFR